MRNAVLLAVAAIALLLGLRRWGPEPFSSPEVLEARARFRDGDRELAHRLAAAALPALAREVAGLPADAERRLALAEALVLAGEPDRGLREARRAASLCPLAWEAGRRRESPLQTLATVAEEAGALAEADSIRAYLRARRPAGMAQAQP